MSTTTAPATKRPRTLPDELVASSMFLLKRLGFAAKERSLDAYERLGLTPYHHAILIALDAEAHATQGSIADALGWDRGQLVGRLDELEERGLVERRRDPSDRRRHAVLLTAAGRKALGDARALSRKLEDEFLAPLSRTERKTLHTLLLRLAEEHDPGCSSAGR